jgi:predicted transcriptional regulator of viral defense system
MNRLTEHFFQASANIFSQQEVVTAIEGTFFSQHGLIKRAIAGGEILNLRRGLYCLAPKFQKSPLSSFSLAQRILGPSYISLESALGYHGWIPEAVYACCCISSKNSKEYKTPLGIFSYKHIPQQALFAGVQRLTDKENNTFYMASPAKALADYIYIHKKKWTTLEDASEDLRIEPEELYSIQPAEIDLLATNYSNKRVKQFLSIWEKAISS